MNQIYLLIRENCNNAVECKFYYYSNCKSTLIIDSFLKNSGILGFDFSAMTKAPETKFNKNVVRSIICHDIGSHEQDRSKDSDLMVEHQD